MVEEKNFEELVDESMNIPDQGKVFTGIVVRIDKEGVFIDFGSKSEGFAPIQDFYNKDGELTVEIGDEVEVMMDNWENEGLPRLSKSKAAMQKESEILKAKFESGELVKAKIKNKVKGGLIADLGENLEIKAFLPGSQIDIRPVSDLDSLVGETIEARIIKLVNQDIVISRRAFLEEQRESLKKETLGNLEEGKVVTGTIVNIINQGVFVDLGGIEGFIPIREVSWGRIKHPSDVVAINDEITVNVIKIENEEKITLSLKDTTTDPWSSVADKYHTGEQVSGKAVSLMDFGVFVELEPGVEGLVHVSEIAWTKNFRHPKEVVDVGSAVQSIVLDVNSVDRRISLSLKQIEPSPWQIFKENNPANTQITGKIKNVTDRGIFVEVAEDIVGLVRPENISWKGRVNPTEEYETGKDLEVVVLNVDEKNQRVGLGVKQLTNDPWDEAQRKYKFGESAVTGKIKDIKDRGLVLELENDIEGYIRDSELQADRERIDLAKTYKIGDEITALVTGIDRRKRQINLSKRKHDDFLEKQRVSNFMSSQGEASVTLGDVLGDKLKSITNDEVA